MSKKDNLNIFGSLDDVLKASTVKTKIQSSMNYRSTKLIADKINTLLETSPQSMLYYIDKSDIDDYSGATVFSLGNMLGKNNFSILLSDLERQLDKSVLNKTSLNDINIYESLIIIY